MSVAYTINTREHIQAPYLNFGEGKTAVACFQLGFKSLNVEDTLAVSKKK